MRASSWSSGCSRSPCCGWACIPLRSPRSCMPRSTTCSGTSRRASCDTSCERRGKMLTGLPVMLLAYPEIFLLAAGCAILVIDLFLKDATRWVTYALSLAALLGCAFLTLIVTGMTGWASRHHLQRHVRLRPDGERAQDVHLYRGGAVPRVFARLHGRAGIVSRRVLRAGAVRDAGDDGHDLRRPFPDFVSGPGADVAVPVFIGGAQSRFRTLERSGDEVLRSGRDRLGPLALRNVDDLRGHGHAPDRRGRQGHGPHPEIG